MAPWPVSSMDGTVVPAGALDKHIAILGKTGSGKSNLARTIAKDLLARDARICMIDPIGNWWGLAYVGNELSGYGNLVLIRHASRWMTAYAHNDALLVETGDMMERGQVISLSGMTGRGLAAAGSF